MAGVYEEGSNMDNYTKKMSMLNVDEPDEVDDAVVEKANKVMPTEHKENKEG